MKIAARFMTGIAAAFLVLPSFGQVPPGAKLSETGQPGPNIPPLEYSRPRAIISPIIHPDHTVTLKLNAPDAHEVRATGHIIGMNAHWLSNPRKSIPMSKDANGVWSVTLGPLAPDIYDYGYLVDGAPTGDPGNRLNIVEVPADRPTYYDVQPVPHGDIRMVIYDSKATHSTRYLRVYTPPGYDDSQKRYPVLYLQHGGNCCEYSWMELARANIIMDNLIAERGARPMIIVMALGARSGPSEGLGPFPSQMEGAKGPGKGQSNYEPGNLFEIDLLNGIIPFIDLKFRTIADANHRALSGLSQGGIQTVTIGLRHSETFHWLAPMSAGAESAGDDQFMTISNDIFTNPGPLKKNLKLLHFVVGEEDVLYEADKRLAERLSALGVKLTFTAVPGMHEYKVWRRGLHDVAPELFQGIN